MKLLKKVLNKFIVSKQLNSKTLWKSVMQIIKLQLKILLILCLKN